MALNWLFLLAYACSGLAGLIYQVTWTRLLTLYMGHSTAAASTVVAAFMGGLAGGSALGGFVAPRLTSRQTLYAYAGMEAVVMVIALALPLELTALVPVLAWAYRDGTPGVLFPAIRLFSCLVVVLIPALALGATFPLAVRWFVRESIHPGRGSGQLYAANTAGAAIGALLAGFILIPTIGISGATLVGVGGSALAIAGILVVIQRSPAEPHDHKAATKPIRNSVDADTRKGTKRRRASSLGGIAPQLPNKRWLAAALLGLSGFSTFVYEIAWTRVLSLVIGPTMYAFAATLAVLIAGIACGSTFGAWLAGRTNRPALWLAFALTGTTVAMSLTTSFVGADLPRVVAEQFERSPYLPDQLLMRHAPLVAGLILPTALGLGVAFPLALELVTGGGPLALRMGLVYCVNTIGAVTGSLVTGFVAIPLLGLQHTLEMASGVLLVAAIIALAAGQLSFKNRIVGLLPAAGTLALLMWSPAWDRELLASGAYLYARRVPPGVNFETSLTAGTLLYYRDGAASTVSVKRLAGTVSLSIDGKVDASSAADMPTQKALGHLPLLLHPNPRDVLVIGLGSGVTAAATLVHPIARLDVVELSPEVVAAATYFANENRNVLSDPRTRLILGDGRSHLLLSPRKYDVIVSEPSNPWMTGVAALFTREFFTAARERLAPDGVICQWAHTYAISDKDLRSIIATFRSVFPQATMWSIGEGDILLVASASAAVETRLELLEGAWQRPGVSADLREVSAFEPFALLSSFLGGPEQLEKYAAGAEIQTDDRMALEFSGPRSIYNSADRDNVAKLRQLLPPDGGPPAIRRAFSEAGPVQWRNRGALMLKVEDYSDAYRDYLKALSLDPGDTVALDGLSQAAVATHREPEALDWLKSSVSKFPNHPAIGVALSKLLATTGAFDEAVAAANAALTAGRGEGAALEQLASIFADVGDINRLDPVVLKLQQIQPDAARTYYAAASKFLRRQFDYSITLAQKAASLDPTYAAAENMAGASYASLGQVEPARQAFQAALRLNPYDDATYVNLGLLELTVGNRVSAAGYFAEALSINPQSEIARQRLAEARAGTN